MERMEILGDAFLKYSVGLFMHYKLTNDVASSSYTGRSHDEGDLSSARARVVSNANLCRVAEDLRLPEGAMRSCREDGDTTWLPPGYSVSRQEEALLCVEARLVAEHGWVVGDCLARVTREEMVALETGGKEAQEELYEKLVARKEAKEPVVGVLRLREHRLVGDKSCADCVESAIGCHLLHGGQHSALHFMAGAGLDLGSTTSLASLFSREPSLGPVLPFSPQTTALCVPRSPSVENRLEQLVAKMD